jgi:ubiquinone/menaquinone biosynthesis C-methylase UbiE
MPGARHEPKGAINVNNQVVGRKNIPNLVQADGADIGRLFAGNSVDRVVGRHMAPQAVDVDRLARGAFRILKPGGVVDYSYRGAGEAETLAQSLRTAGFVNVRLAGGMPGPDGRPVGGNVWVVAEKPSQF